MTYYYKNMSRGTLFFRLLLSEKNGTPFDDLKNKNKYVNFVWKNLSY